MSITEYNLIQALRQGDSDAFHKIYLLYVHKIYNFIKCYVKSDAQSEELVQVVFVKIWENHKNIIQSDSLSGYIYKIAKNCAFNYLKHQIYLRAFENNAGDDSQLYDNDLLKKVISKDLESHLSKFIDHMPPKRREIFILSRIHGLSYKEIASKLEVSENTVDTHLRLAVKELKNKLKLIQ